MLSVILNDLSVFCLFFNLIFLLLNKKIIIVNEYNKYLS